MSIPIAYNLRNLVVRKTTTIMTALGIALTVAVLLAILALVNGLRSTLTVSGDPLHVLVLRKGSDSELVSLFTRSQFQDLKFKAGIATGRDGQPLASMEVVTIMILDHANGSGSANFTVRGLAPAGIEMRRNVHLLRGRWFQPGQREVVVGKAVTDQFPEQQIGKRIHFGRGEWETLLCSIFFMGQILWVGKREFSDNRPGPVTLILFSFQGAAFLALAVATAPGAHALLAPWQSPAWLGLTLALTLFCTIGAFSIMNRWQPKITSTEAGLIYCVEPLFAAVFVLFLPAIFSGWAGIDYPNEHATWSLVIGGGLITLANGIIQMSPEAHEQPTQELSN